jgi:hypothetical protein
VRLRMGEWRLSLGNSEEQTQHFYAAGSSLLIDLSSLINNFAPDGSPPPNMIHHQTTRDNFSQEKEIDFVLRDCSHKSVTDSRLQDHFEGRMAGREWPRYHNDKWDGARGKGCTVTRCGHPRANHTTGLKG